MTIEVYHILMKALRKEIALVRRSPEAAKKVLVDTGLWDLLEDNPDYVPKPDRLTATAGETPHKKKNPRKAC